MPDASPASPSSIRRLGEAAQELASLAAQLGHEAFAATIVADSRRRLEAGRVRVVVVGEVKHGKTTLLNALLGAELLPTGVTPTTAATVAIRSDREREGAGAFLVSGDGTRLELEPERFEHLARGRERDELGRALELRVGSQQLPPTLEFIDTPGFNDIDGARGISHAELGQADVLVLVLDATQVLSRSELGAIRDALEAVGGLDESGVRCVVAINRVDLVPVDERERVVEHVRSKLAALIPTPLDLHLTDAKTALGEPRSGTAPARAVARLRAELHELAGRGHEFLPVRARAALLGQARLLSYNGAVQARGLRLEQAELAAEIAAVEDATAAQTVDLATLRQTIADGEVEIIRAFEARASEFRAELEDAVLAQIEHADMDLLTQTLPGAVQDSFLQFVHHEREELREELEQLTREVLSTCGELARRRLEAATMPLIFHGPALYVEPPEVLVEVGLVALGLVAVAISLLGNAMTGVIMTIMIVATPLTALALDEKALRDARSQIRGALPAACDRAMGALRAVVVKAVERHRAALDEHLMLADRSVARQLLESLHNAELRLAVHEQRLAQLVAVGSANRPSADGCSAESSGTELGPSDAPRLRERVRAAAQTEFNGLEGRLQDIVAELESLALGDVPASEYPSVIL